MGERGKINFFDKPETVKKVKVASYVVLVLSVIGGFTFPNATHHFWDGIPGFYALLGFSSCAALIILCKLLGYWLKKRKDYYE
jgi:hypothetical protein